jgi:hypothetical protein
VGQLMTPILKSGFCGSGPRERRTHVETETETLRDRDRDRDRDMERVSEREREDRPKGDMIPGYSQRPD